MFSQLMGTSQGIQDGSTALEANKDFLPEKSQYCVLEWCFYGSDQMEHSDDKTPECWQSNECGMEFSLVSALAIWVEGQHSSFPERWCRTGSIFKTLVSCHKPSLVSSGSYQQRGLLNIKNFPDSCCGECVIRHCQQQADLRCRWRQMSWEKANADCPLRFSLWERWPCDWCPFNLFGCF